MKSKIPAFKFTATPKGIVIYYCWLLFNIGLLSVKNTSFVQQHFAEVFSHTSNFIITAILMSAVGLIWTLQGAPFKFILWLGFVAVSLNFIMELFIPLLNTRDVVDAVYGTAGVSATALVLFIFQKTGIKVTPPST